CRVCAESRPLRARSPASTAARSALCHAWFTRKERIAAAASVIVMPLVAPDLVPNVALGVGASLVLVDLLSDRLELVEVHVFFFDEVLRERGGRTVEELAHHLLQGGASRLSARDEGVVDEGAPFLARLHIALISQDTEQREHGVVGDRLVGLAERLGDV